MGLSNYQNKNWIGFKKDKVVLNISYDKIASILVSQQNLQRAYNPELVIGISRGGIVPASMIASNLSLPLLLISVTRGVEETTWLSPPNDEILNTLKSRKIRVLLVDDIVSSGETIRKSRKFLENLGFKVIVNTIFYDKKYANLKEAFQDLQNIYVFLAKSKLRVTVKDSSFRDKYMTSVFFSKDTKDVLDGLKFETKYSSIQEVLANEIKKQIELGGWQIVDSPEKADKQVYLDISRDYALIELEYFKREKKNIKFSSLESDTNNVKFYQNRKYDGSHITLGQSAMNFASASNGNLVSAAIGLSVAGVFSLLGNEKAPDKENTTGSFISLRIFDKKENTDTIKIYDSFIKSAYDKRNIEDLLQKINETINIDPNSKKYNIN